jgi:hypothetical protein
MRGRIQARALSAATAAALAGVLMAHCAGDSPPIPPLRAVGDGGTPNLTGYVVKGPVSGGRVTAYRLRATISRKLTSLRSREERRGLPGRRAAPDREKAREARYS